MGFLIDSSVLITIERASGDPAEIIAQHTGEPAAIAAITAAELLHGVHRADGARRQKRSDFVENILATLPIISYDLDVAREHARIWAELQQRGEIIGPHDMQIAAT